MTDFQKYLDEATRWQKVETIQLHAITCDCEACKEIQQKEYEARWGKK
jgi:hypothetical protein